MGIFVDDVRAIPIIDEFFGFMGIISPWSSDGGCNKREKGLFVYDKALFYWYRPADRIEELKEVMKKVWG